MIQTSRNFSRDRASDTIESSRGRRPGPCKAKWYFRRPLRILVAAAAIFSLVTANAADTVKPTVNITSPAPGSTVSGTVTVSVSATDNVAIARVDLYLNSNTRLGGDSTLPYALSWNTTTVANGSVMLTAVAYDSSGNKTHSAVINVTVANGTTVSPTQPTLSVKSSNPTSGVSVRVYPADLLGLGDGAATLTRKYNTNARVWLSAPLRSGNNYFVKWQKDGVDYDTASTTSVVVDANRTLTAVYQTPTCVGVAVFPGTNSLKNAAAAYPAGSTFCIKAGVHRMKSR